MTKLDLQNHLPSKKESYHAFQLAEQGISPGWGRITFSSTAWPECCRAIQSVHGICHSLIVISVFFCFARVMADKKKEVLFVRPRKYIQCSNPETTEPGYINIMELAASVCRYDLDDMDIFWLQELNEDLTAMGKLFPHM